ncbi:MAG: hypothetical protein QM754_06375 [Tepidisphaeraceae bacterium]
MVEASLPQKQQFFVSATVSQLSSEDEQRLRAMLDSFINDRVAEALNDRPQKGKNSHVHEREQTEGKTRSRSASVQPEGKSEKEP